MHGAESSNPFYGWKLLVFLGIAYSIQIGFCYYGPPVLLPFMTESMSWSRGETMVGYTLMIAILAISSPLIALLVNRFGARNVLFSGGMIMAVSTVCMSFWGHNYSLYLIVSALNGLGAGFATMIATQTVIVSWFHARRAMAMGIVLGGGAIGGFLAPQIISATVLASDGNWRIGWFVITFASIIGAAITLAKVRNSPSDVGQHPDGLDPDQSAENMSNRKNSKGTYHTSANWTVGDALKSPVLWLIIVALGAELFLWHIVKVQTPFHLRDRNFAPSQAALFYSLAIGFSILGRFITAALGDRIEPRYLIAGASILIFVGGILFWFASPEVPLVVYIYPLLSGCGFGIAYVCMPTILGNYFGVKSFPLINGIAYPIVALIELSGTPLAGYLYDLQGSYFTILLIGWIGAIIAFIAMMFCRPPKLKAT